VAGKAPPVKSDSRVNHSKKVASQTWPPPTTSFDKQHRPQHHADVAGIEHQCLRSCQDRRLGAGPAKTDKIWVSFIDAWGSRSTMNPLD
jgi:hypothetical protein